MKKVLAAAAMIMALAACAGKGEDKQPNTEVANQAVEQALQECRAAVEAKPSADQAQNQAAFEACMKEKGFERPATQEPAPVAPASAPAN